jgi:3-phosphoinositide dependent protein kinase-1
MLLTGAPPFKGGSDYLTFKRVLACKYRLPEGMPPVAADLIEKLLVVEPERRLGGRWPEGRPAASQLKGTGGPDFLAPVKYYHEEIRAHPFFEGHRGRELWKARVPLPTLEDMAMRELMQKVRREGGAALGPAAAMAAWPDALRTRVAFECLKRELLTEQMRSDLGWGPAPPPIKDDLEEFETGGAAGDNGDAEEDDEGANGDEEEDEVEEAENDRAIEGERARRAKPGKSGDRADGGIVV